MARDFYKILGLKRKDKPSGEEIKKVITDSKDPSLLI